MRQNHGRAAAGQGTGAEPPAKPAVKPPAKPIAKPPAAPPARTAHPSGKPIAEAAAALPAQPAHAAPATASAAPTAEPPPPTPPSLPREPGMVAVPLPPAEQPEECGGGGRGGRCSPCEPGLAFSSWLRKLWPAAERHLPADATIPGKAERRIALRLAAVPAAAALVSLLPVFTWAMPIFCGASLGVGSRVPGGPAVGLCRLDDQRAGLGLGAGADGRLCRRRDDLRHADDLDDDHAGQSSADSRSGRSPPRCAGLVRADARPHGRGHVVLRPGKRKWRRSSMPRSEE